MPDRLEEPPRVGCHLCCPREVNVDRRRPFESLSVTIQNDRVAGQSYRVQEDRSPQRRVRRYQESDDEWDQFPINLITRRVRASQGLQAYLTFELEGMPVECLMDTGCEATLVPESIARQANLQVSPTNIVLYAANDSSVTIVGACQINLYLDGICYPSSVLVSPDLSETLIGLEWMRHHRVVWRTEQHSVEINNRKYQLHFKQKDRTNDKTVSGPEVNQSNHIVRICSVQSKPHDIGQASGPTGKSGSSNRQKLRTPQGEIATRQRTFWRHTRSQPPAEDRPESGDDNEGIWRRGRQLRSNVRPPPTTPSQTTTQSRR